MESSHKIIIGAVATALLAWGSHSGLGAGEKFVGGLEDQARSVLSTNAMSGITVAAERDPAIKRILVLSGDKTEAEKAAALAAVRAIPGVFDARWADDGKVAAPAVTPEAPATVEAVAQCQGDIDTLMTGKVVNFTSGSAGLAPESTALLAEVAKALKPCAGTKVEIQGHTDLTGNPAANETLSQARAEAVLKALVDGGVPAERLTAKGYGSAQPVENAVNAAANAKNRRTVFAVASSAAAAPEGGQ